MNSWGDASFSLSQLHRIFYFNLTQLSTHHSFKKVLCKMFWVELHKMRPGGQQIYSGTLDKPVLAEVLQKRPILKHADSDETEHDLTVAPALSDISLRSFFPPLQFLQKVTE